MKLLIVAILVAVAAAAPQVKRGELKNYNTMYGELPQRWNFAYEVKDENEPQMHSRQEAGEVKKIGDNFGSTYVGSFSFVSPEGQKFTVDYIADENGFRPVGAHIPAAK